MSSAWPDRNAHLFYEKRYPIIDAHLHGGFYRAFGVYGGDGAGMVSEMDACGVDLGVLSSHCAIASDFRLGNDLTMSWVRQYPQRLIGYCYINPNYPGEVEAELDRCFATGLFRGIKIHPELNGDYPMDGPNYRPMWRYAAEHRVPVLFHTYFGGDRHEVMERLAAEYETATFLVGHCAVDLGLEKSVAMARRRPNMILDITGPQRQNGIVEYLVGSLGADRILYGSDMPFIDLGTMVGAVLHAHISEAEREQLFWQTAARIFRLDLKEFGLQGTAAETQ
jgi:uncharacterized protein